MSEFGQLWGRYVAAHQVKNLEMPALGVKLYKRGEVVPAAVRDTQPEGVTFTCCQATKQAMLGDAVYITRDTIGCVAAAISLGLAGQDENQPIQDSLVYTDIMRKQSGKGASFAPPSPRQFTDGTVYACAAAKRPEFGLFGPKDSGRFRDLLTARRAISGMSAIQPADTQGVFLFPPTFEDLDLQPDVVLLSLRPVELTRMIQGYSFITGERIQSTMGGLRVVCSDVIARPHLSGEINVSTYCLGARLIAQYDANHMSVGVPYKQLALIVEGLEASQTGYPFQAFPGAAAS